jgi:hypothetical protein
MPDKLIVNEVTENVITAGWWEFDRNTGVEIDEDISVPVSYISEIILETSEEKSIFVTLKIKICLQKF